MRGNVTCSTYCTFISEKYLSEVLFSLVGIDVSIFVKRTLGGRVAAIL